MGPTDFVVAITVATGLLFVVVALLSLRPGSRIRRLYGIDVDDDGDARSNAIVLGLCGLGLVALAAGIVVDVPVRVLETGTVVVSAGACIGLGLLVRYRDRRELLTTPSVDRETARRLGAAVIVCGVAILPIAPAAWVGASGTLVAGLVLGATFVCLLAIALAYR